MERLPENDGLTRIGPDGIEAYEGVPVVVVEDGDLLSFEEDE